MWRMGAHRVAADDRSSAERLTLNYLTRTMLALAKTGDTEMIERFRRFSATERRADIMGDWAVRPLFVGAGCAGRQGSGTRR